MKNYKHCKNWFQTSFLHKDTLTFLRHLSDLQKNFQIILLIVIFSPKIWQLFCQYFYQNSCKTLTWKSIRASLEKMVGAHRTVFLGYKDAHQKLRFTQGFFTPDTKLYSGLINALSRYSSNWHQTKS